MSMPIIPPFAIKASYQNAQYGSMSNIYTPGVPSVFSYLVSPPTTGTDAETVDDNDSINAYTGSAVSDVYTTGHVQGAVTAYSAASQVETITIVGAPSSGNWLITYGGQTTATIAYNAAASVVQARINALSNIPAATGGTNDVQTVTLTNATGGTFTLTFGGQTTAAINYNALASDVATKLVALSSVGAGNVTVTGSAGGPYTVTFTSALGHAPQTAMTANGASLTGSSPSVGVVHTTTGVLPTPNVTVTGSNGGPYTVTFGNLLADVQVAPLLGQTALSVNGAGLGGGVDPSVSVALTTQGKAAFLNTGLLAAASQYDPMVDFYDAASGNNWNQALLGLEGATVEEASEQTEEGIEEQLEAQQ
jgi:hypothetical protein